MAATVMGIFKEALDKSLEQKLAEHQDYSKAKSKLAKEADHAGTFEKVSAAAGIGGIVLVTLGMGCFAAGRGKLGAVLVCANVPLSIFSYNCYQASENFRSQVDEKPTKFMIYTAADERIAVNQVALRKCLLKGTLFFEPFLGFYVQILKSV